jgi:hypothetical protein
MKIHNLDCANFFCLSYARCIFYKINNEKCLTLVSTSSCGNGKKTTTAIKENIRAKSSGMSNKKHFFLDCLTLDDGTDMLSQTSVTNYHSTLCKTKKEGRFHWEIILCIQKTPSKPPQQREK